MQHMLMWGYEMLQNLIVALGDATRRRALLALSDGGEHCLCELMPMCSASQSRMSRHMAALKAAGIVRDRRDAQWVRYRLDPELAPHLANVLQAVLAAARHEEGSDTCAAA
jgi:ArsR family transcriptional regulator